MSFFLSASLAALFVALAGARSAASLNDGAAARHVNVWRGVHRSSLGTYISTIHTLARRVNTENSITMAWFCGRYGIMAKHPSFASRHQRITRHAWLARAALVTRIKWYRRHRASRRRRHVPLA